MATWNKTKVNASDVNNGNQFSAGDGVRNTDVNKIFESGLYSQDVVENIGIGTVTTGEPGSSAKASVTYDSTTGYPKINLTLPRGVAGPQGETGSVGTLSSVINGFWTSYTIGSAQTFLEEYSSCILFVSSSSAIIKPSMSAITLNNYISDSTIASYYIEFSLTKTSFKINFVRIMEVTFNEDGTISRNISYKNSGNSLNNVALIGLKF